MEDVNMATNRKAGRYSLMVHGGAGALDELRDGPKASAYREGIRRVLEHGRGMLAEGAAALDVVTACAALLEDDPLFNAGRGSVLNEEGRVEMDAAVMDGRDLAAGAVAGVHNIANPVELARRVMSETPHVMLVGEGAMRLAAQCGMAQVADDYFQLPERVAQLQQARRTRTITLDHAPELDARDPGKLGTIGAVARDVRGDLAAATSTGGMVNKRVGRVGDTPIVGAGVYADNTSCAVSATGYGEDLMRSVLARRIADLVELQGMDAEQATRAGIEYFRLRVQGRGGVIVIDHEGNCASGLTTPNMIHGWIAHAGEAVVRF